jgi:hypothetical protein
LVNSLEKNRGERSRNNVSFVVRVKWYLFTCELLKQQILGQDVDQEE